MVNNTESKHRSARVIGVVIAVVIAAAVIVGALAWNGPNRYTPQAAQEQTQTVPATESRELKESRAALEKKLAEAQKVYDANYSKVVDPEICGKLGALIEGTEGLLEAQPALAENFKSRATELDTAMKAMQEAAKEDPQVAYARLAKETKAREAEADEMQAQADKINAEIDRNTRKEYERQQAEMEKQAEEMLQGADQLS